jgi:hypothetical protein
MVRPGDGEVREMLAYKFLDHDHRAVFSGFRWPLPASDGEAGPWVETGSVVPCREGIHGCRPSGVGFWLNEELWEVELAGDIVEVGTKVVASRGRLRRRIGDWAGAAARELVEVTAFRARDTAVAFCRNGSGPGAAPDAPGLDAAVPGADAGVPGAATASALDALGVCTEIGELGPAAVAAYEVMPEGSPERTAVGFVIDAAHFVDAHVCHTPFISACTAAHAASARTGRRTDSKAAVAAERAWQSAWITDRLGLH